MSLSGLIIAAANRIYYRPTRSSGSNKTEFDHELQRASALLFVTVAGAAAATTTASSSLSVRRVPSPVVFFFILLRRPYSEHIRVALRDFVDDFIHWIFSCRKTHSSSWCQRSDWRTHQRVQCA